MNHAGREWSLLTGATIVLLGCMSIQKPSSTTITEFSPPVFAAMNAPECTVWRRERSFADSVDRHDTLAFSQHVSSDAIFFSDDPQPTRGRDAIVREWAGIIAGESSALHWYPGTVQIAGNGKIALSRGLYWTESGKSVSPKRYAIGHFISTWSQESDGVWRVLYDGGNTDRPARATESDIKRLKASLPAECPTQ